MPMQVFTVGQVLAAGDVNEYLVNTRYASKPNDTSRANTNVITADPDLTLPVDANKSYFVEANILFTAAGPGTGDLKANWAVPAGAVFTGIAIVASSTIFYQASASLITSNVQYNGSGATMAGFQLSGVLALVGTGGSMTFQWAQQTSNATPTVVKQGSSLYLRRVS